MNLWFSIPNGSLVQVVTDYSLERIGRIERTSFDEDFIKIMPHDNGELRKAIAAGGVEVKATYEPSVRWPILVLIKNIKEIIVLQNGQNPNTKIEDKSKETESSSSDSYEKHAV